MSHRDYCMVGAKWIGGPGYSFNRTGFDLSDFVVREAKILIVADVHSYARDYFLPDKDGVKPNSWLLAGSQIKCRIYVNGRMIGLGPARPVGDLPYVQEFDFLGALSAGQNTLGVLSLGEKRGFALRARIVLEDGREIIIHTDSGWKSMRANEVFRSTNREAPGVDCFFKGFPGPGEAPQHIDGQLYPSGWSESSHDDSGWPSAETFGPADGTYPVLDISNLHFEETLPERLLKLDNGHYFFDFGREIVGSMKLQFAGAHDGKVELRLGEECSEPDRVRYVMRTQNCYQEIWKTADRPLVLEHFGLRAFRYGEVIGWPGEVTEGDIAATLVRYPFDDDAADFKCSNRVLNDVWQLCKYSVKATNMDIYQDCPSRERQAYEGDAYINMLSHYALDSDTRLARHTAEYLLKHPTWPAEWTMLMIPIFWADYMQTGAPSMIDFYYETLRDQFSFNHLLEDGLVREFPKRVIVDWPESQCDGYEFGLVNAAANAYVYQDLKILSRMAGMLGRESESEELSLLASSVCEAFNRRMFDDRTGLYVDHEGSAHSSFHANLFPLAFGLVPDTRVSGCLDFLKSKGMICSVYTAQFFLDALYDHGEAEYALGLLTAKSGNSWGHMLYDLGATITTESWDPSQKENMSWAHPWATAPANIVARRLFGIQPVEAGWGKLTINPQPGGLEWGEIRVPTPMGPVTARFEREENGLSLTYSAPEHCRVIIEDRECPCSGRVVLNQ